MYLAASSKTVSNSRDFIKKDGPHCSEVTLPLCARDGKALASFFTKAVHSTRERPPWQPSKPVVISLWTTRDRAITRGAGVPPARSPGRCHTCGALRFPTRWCAGQASPDPVGRRGKQTGPGCLAPVGSPASPSRPAPQMSVQARERTPASLR